MSSYTLRDYTVAANVTNCPDWFAELPLKYAPHPHQVNALKFAFKFERVGDFSDAGTGKTFPMQAYAVVMAGYGNKVVVVMPPKLIGQFSETFEEFFVGVGKRVSIAHLRLSKGKRDKTIQKWTESGEWPDILIMSYNAFKYYASTTRQITKKERIVGRPRPLIHKLPNPAYKLLQKAGYNVLIADEAQALKNPSSGNHKAFWEYVGETKGEVCLYLATGSPIPRELEDAYGCIRLLTPEVYPTKWAFDRQHVERDPDCMYRTVIGYKNHDLLNENLYRQAHRTTKQQAYPDLADPIVTSIKVTLSRPHQALYEQVVKQRFLELPSGEYVSANNDSKMRALAKQVVSCPESFSDKPVVNELRETMDAVMDSIDPSKNKVIIFSYFKETVASLAKHYAQWNPAVINGATTDSEVERHRFLQDDSCRVLIMNWASGGVGLNLQISKYILFAETPTVPMEAYQAIARSHRGGQLGQVSVWFFRVMRTICARQMPKLLNRDVENNLVVRDRHNLLSDLMGGKSTN